ncbi:choline metabolism transcriptional regulator GbdR [Marinobacterium arenosum]|uniref:choline metabolism transcriptional regulator GbdR n=1 Tax=Marinobacterium arenosum TaxID=2862496 RepID=UPI001C98A6FC|nr:GlxA family transcriptional regulator [Marinobacterium arenosum]MBY4678062.1 GlxA family transcriptional regulator [Marinobacterium arenosum]
MTELSGTGDRSQPYRVGFLLVDNFTLIALATAIEPLRMANQIAGSEIYTWQLLSVDGQPARASDGIAMLPDAAISHRQRFDLVIVVAGVDVTRSYSRRELTWLKAMARQRTSMGAVCTGAYVLASAGLLDGYGCSTHWECLAAMREGFPKVHCNDRLYTLERDRMTCTGGSVPLHMMLNFLARRHGKALVDAVSDMFICDRVREATEQQPMSLRQQLMSSQPKLAEVAQLMEANIEEPLALQELAQLAGVSRRKLERWFLKHLGCSPWRYYLKLRLARARRLLKQTACPIVEVASMCGFVSATHFSRCYRKYMGIAPRAERLMTCEDPPPVDPQAEPLEEVFSASRHALRKARVEPTYGVCDSSRISQAADRVTKG